MKPRRRRPIVIQQRGHHSGDLFNDVLEALDHFEIPTTMNECDLIHILRRLDRALAKQPLSVRAACRHGELRSLVEQLA